MHALLLTQSPQSHQAAQAFAFAEQLCQQQTPFSVFLYMDAVYMANAFCWQTADQTSLQQQWQQLAKTHDFRLKVCVSNALSRGITDTQNSERQGITLQNPPNSNTSNTNIENVSNQPNTPEATSWADNLAQGFDLVGLGELAEDMFLATSIYIDTSNQVNTSSAHCKKRILLQLTSPIDKYSEEALLAVFALSSFEHCVKIVLSHHALELLTQPTHKVYKMLSSASLYDIALMAHAQATDHLDNHLNKSLDSKQDMPLEIISQSINQQDFDLIWSV